MADEPLRWFPNKVADEEEIRMVVSYPAPNGTIKELKNLSTIINAILTVLRTGIYPGYPGIPGGGGEIGDMAKAILVERVAATTIKAGQAVCVNSAGQVVLASNVESQYEYQLGVAIENCNLGSLCKLVTAGTVTVNTWTFQAGEELYVGTAGLITMTVPQTGTFWKLGRAMSATAIVVAPETPLKL